MKLTKLLMVFLLFIMVSGVFATQAKIGDSLISIQSDHDEDDDSTDSEDESDEEDESNDDDNDGIDDDREEAYERDIETEEEPDRFRVESEMRNGDAEDEFSVEFKVSLNEGGDEPEIEFEYSTEANDIENELEYEVNFDEIIEFFDNGSLPGLDENDTIVGEPYELDKQSWNPLVYETLTIDGETMKVVTATTTDGVVSIILKVASAIINLDNDTIITPNSIKIDIVISNFPYQETGTYLALQTDIKTSSETEYDDISEDEEQGFASNESEVNISSLDAQGFFSWAEWAEADNQTIDVISSTLIDADEDQEDDDLEEGEFHRILYFTFDAQNPQEIVWDPKVGVESQAIMNYLAGNINSEALSSLPGFLVIFSTISFLAISVIYRRKQTIN